MYFFLQCTDFVKAGAKQGLTPSDVVLAADITFSCVADPQAAKDVSDLLNSNVFKSILIFQNSFYGIFITLTFFLDGLWQLWCSDGDIA